MDKGQAIHSFWSSFGLTAYDENSVPDNAEMPRITYNVSEDSIGNVVSMSGSLWYKSDSWREISLKKDEIAEAIGYGLKNIKLDNGYLVIAKGVPFAQRMNDAADDSIRRYYINIQAEFLTAY